MSNRNHIMTFRVNDKEKQIIEDKAFTKSELNRKISYNMPYEQEQEQGLFM